MREESCTCMLLFEFSERRELSGYDFADEPACAFCDDAFCDVVF